MQSPYFKFRASYCAVAVFVLSACCPGAIRAQNKSASMTAHVNTFVISNQQQRVSVRDAQGKRLFLSRIVTPNLLLAIHIPTRKEPGRLTLQDEKGHALWSALIANDRKTVVRGGWSQAGISFVPEKSHEKTAEDEPKLHDGVALIGPDNSLIKAEFGEGENAIKFNTSSGGANIQAGEMAVSMKKESDDNYTMTLNGKSTQVTTIIKNGKKYTTFEWNGVRYNIAAGCQFHIDNDGEITINRSPN